MKWISRTATDRGKSTNRSRALTISVTVLSASWVGGFLWGYSGLPIPLTAGRLMFFAQYASLGAVIGCAAARGRSSGAYWGALVGFILADLLMLR